jgi:hypothetical protein
MRVWLALGSVLLLNACTVPVWRDTPVRSWGQATGGEHLERLFWEEIKAKRWAELERHVSGTFVSVTPTGRFNRAQTIAYFKGLQISDFTLSDCDVQPNGADATVSCSLTLHGNPGRPFISSSERTMTVWQHGAHGWMAIAHSAVPLPAQ